jgi:hypothetical protein
MKLVKIFRSQQQLLACNYHTTDSRNCIASCVLEVYAGYYYNRKLKQYVVSFGLVLYVF